MITLLFVKRVIGADHQVIEIVSYSSWDFLGMNRPSSAHDTRFSRQCLSVYVCENNELIIIDWEIRGALSGV
jgi:hypothetical protein